MCVLCDGDHTSRREVTGLCIRSGLLPFPKPELAAGKSDEAGVSRVSLAEGGPGAVSVRLF